MASSASDFQDVTPIRRRLLLFIFNRSHFRDMMRLVQLVEGQDWEPVLFFGLHHPDRLYPGAEIDIARCLARGLPVYLDGRRVGTAGVAAADTDPDATGGRPFPAPDKAVPVEPLRQTLAEARFLRRKRRALCGLLNGIAPSLMVFCEDNVSLPTSLYAAAGQAIGIRSLVIPFCLTDQQELLQILANRPEHFPSPDMAAALRRMEAVWLAPYRERDLCRMPAPTALAFSLAGVAPRQPWIYHDGPCDIIAVESRWMFDRYCRDGLDPARLRVVGSLTDDLMAGMLASAEAEREALCRRLSLDPNRRLVVCALPGDVFNERTDPGAYPDFAAMRDHWIAALSRFASDNVLVVPHPTHMRTALQVELPPFMRVCTEDTARLVPLCDLYVACVSSTIRWAIACGKPVVDFDVYGFKYDYFRSMEGVVTVDSPADFEAVLERLAGDPHALQALADKQSMVARLWGELDGRTGSRLLALMEELHRPVPAPGLPPLPMGRRVSWSAEIAGNLAFIDRMNAPEGLDAGCPFLLDPSSLNAGRRIFIYGSGVGGRALRTKLTSQAGLSVTAFLDSHQSGCVDGVPRIPVDSYVLDQREGDQILIASVYLWDIRRELTSRGIGNAWNALPYAMD